MSQITEQQTYSPKTGGKPAAQMSLQEFAETIRSLAEDIGQISEMSSEEKLLVAEFFKSFLKLMQPLASSIPVSIEILPAEIGNIKKAYVDPTGHIALIHEDERMELRNLADEQNRDLMILVVQNVMPKFKILTSEQKTKIENRVQFLSTVTKEIQRVSDTMATLYSAAQK